MSVAAAAAQHVPAVAHGTGTIGGSVLTSDGSLPLPQAIVTLQRLIPPSAEDGAGGQPLGPSRTTVTRQDGSYRFTDVNPAFYRLEIRRIGYLPATVDVELRHATEVTVSAVLEISPVRLQLLEVNAAALDLFGRGDAVDEIGRRRIDVERWRQRAFLSSDVRALTHTDVLESVTLGTADPFRALQRLPGVTTRDDWTSEVWIRGASWGQTRVFFDGLPLFNPLHAGGATSALNENALGSVLFHPGVRPLVLGEGAAGVVSFTSRPAGGTGDIRGYGDLTLFGGGVTLERRFGGGRVGVLAGVRKSGLDFITSQSELNNFALPDTYADVIGRIDIGVTTNTHIEMSGLWEIDRIDGEIDGGPTRNDMSWGNAASRVTLDVPMFGAYSRHTVGWSQFRLKVRQTEPTPSISLYNWIDPTQINSDGKVFQVTFKSEFGSAIPEEDDAGWRAGSQVTVNRSLYLGAPESPHPFQLYSGPLELDERLVVVSFWGESRLKPARDLTVQGGIRVDGTTSALDGGRFHLGPQISARYRANEQLSLSASVGRSYQYVQTIAPAGLSVGPGLAVSHIWRLSGESVPPLQSDVVTVGAEYWLADEWLSSLNLYGRQTAGVTLVDPTPGPKQNRPSVVVGENDAVGVEASIRRIAGPVTMSINYTLGSSHADAAGLRFPASSDRRHSLDASGAWRVPRTLLGGSIRLAAAYTAASGAPYTRVHPGYYECNYELDYCVEHVPDILEPPNAVRAPWYSALDVLGEWTKEYSAWRFALQFQIRNVLNRNNAITYAVSRTGDCGRSTLDAPFCTRDDDVFHNGVNRKGILGLKVEF